MYKEMEKIVRDYSLIVCTNKISLFLVPARIDGKIAVAACSKKRE